MESHVRIDEGVKRGPRTPRNSADPETGRFLPVIPPEQRAAAIERAHKRVENGEFLKDIAADIGVTHQALSLWLLDDLGPQYAVAQRRGLIQRIVNADQGIEDARDPLALARAREAARFARWDAERRLPKLFGQQTHVTVELTGDLGERLRRSRERTVEGEVVAVVEQAAKPQLTDSIDGAAQHE